MQSRRDDSHSFSSGYGSSSSGSVKGGDQGGGRRHFGTHDDRGCSGGGGGGRHGGDGGGRPGGGGGGRHAEFEDKDGWTFVGRTYAWDPAGGWHTNRSSKGPKGKHEESGDFPRHAIPKLSFPKFEGTNPRIWIDKCINYFKIFKVPSCMWATAASLHMEGNAAKWLQVYKQQHGLGKWKVFVAAVERKFGAYDYRRHMHDFLHLRQKGTVEEYAEEFESARYHLAMHNEHLDETMFVSHFVEGLKDDIRGTVLSHVPEIVDLTRRCSPPVAKGGVTYPSQSSRSPSPALPSSAEDSVRLVSSFTLMLSLSCSPFFFDSLSRRQEADPGVWARLLLAAGGDSSSREVWPT
ncbi:hypothetical protein PR202_gb23339 [Eleusine coracana subsp. coracana]|uniref:Retrotransposon gag domain-containing protein n=1 Tax=Eleusine coracana subsp. coracana TaxID=191504 RepID=A0AAV5FIQ9_ELECO|nr:hypothetical protein PR202_gb23339 [Eleusine coracana subsp. coracana]